MENLAKEIKMAKKQPDIYRKYWLQGKKHDTTMTILLMSLFAYFFNSRDIIFIRKWH